MTDACLEPGLRTIDKALEELFRLIHPTQITVQKPLKQALGWVLAEDVKSPIDVPPFCNSYMDGYALHQSDSLNEAPLKIVGTSWAGHPYSGAIQHGECIRIFTGAKVPDEVDCVVMQEHVVRDDETIRLQSTLQTGENLRYAGDDIKTGETVLAQGRQLQSADLGLLASIGLDTIPVFAKPRVAYFSTGDELVPAHQRLDDGQIHDSNRYLLWGLLQEIGIEATDMGVIPDQKEAVEQALKQAAASHDVIITTGGASVGDADFIAETLDKVGKIDFWKIAMRPGKPQVVGEIGKARFFGLPGNPVSVMVNFCQIVRPALLYWQGATDLFPFRLNATAACPIRKQAGRTDFQRGVLSRDSHGGLQVVPTGHQGSNILSSASRGNCFIVLPLESTGVDAGEPVQVEPFSGPYQQEYYHA